MRGFAFIIGSLLKIKFIKNIDLHKGLGIFSFMMGFSILFFSYTLNKYLLCVISFVSFLFFNIFDIFLNTSLMKRGKSEVKFYMTLNYIFANLGAFVGPYIISYWGIETYIIIGIFSMLLSIIYFSLPKFL